MRVATLNRCAAVVVLALACSILTTCSSNKRATLPNQPRIDPQDSAHAVALAIEEYKRDARSPAVDVRVARFVKDSAGSLITLTPADERTRGGVRVIRVTRDGRAIIVEGHQ